MSTSATFSFPSAAVPAASSRQISSTLSLCRPSLSFLSPPPPLSLSVSRNAAFWPVARVSGSDAPVLESEAPTVESDAVVPVSEATEIVEAAGSGPKREEIFAVVMIGSRQYIVIPGRWIYTQRLKGANVNDKVVLNKVLLVGTRNSTYIGMPVVTNAAVHAVVEEQLLDKKVIVFKYKKKKNYRRNIGHRQPITRIRITGITGYEDYPASTLDS